MRIIQKENLFQLSFLPRIFPVNCYIVEEENGVTLIDAALPYSVKGIIHTIEKIGKPLSRIVLTHIHNDHVGSLDALKTHFPKVPVYVSSRDARLMDGNLTLDPDEPQTPIRGGVPKALQTRPDVLVADGDEIGSLLVIASPGHTPGSISLLDQRTGALVVGDAMHTRTAVAVSGMMTPLFPFPAMATWNKQVALDSVRKLVALNPTLLAAGHGNLILDPIHAMGSAVKKAELAFGSVPGESERSEPHVT